MLLGKNVSDVRRLTERYQLTTTSLRPDSVVCTALRDNHRDSLLPCLSVCLSVCYTRLSTCLSVCMLGIPVGREGNGVMTGCRKGQPKPCPWE